MASPGTVLFVSHDRYFIDGLATRVFECEHGGVQVFPGNYEDYLWRKNGGPESLQAAAMEMQRAHIPIVEAPPAPISPVTTPAVVNVKKAESRSSRNRCSIASALPKTKCRAWKTA